MSSASAVAEEWVAVLILQIQVLRLEAMVALEEAVVFIEFKVSYPLCLPSAPLLLGPEDLWELNIRITSVLLLMVVTAELHRSMVPPARLLGVRAVSESNRIL